MSMMPSEVPSLVIPLENSSLLVPNSCVAEIVPYASTLESDGSHAWLVGSLVWRDLNLPCISFEHLLNSETSEIKKADRIAIFNTTSDIFGLRFYGISISGIPRLARVVEQEIVEEAVEHSAFEKLKVQLNGEACIIPDLEAIEKLLSTAGLS